MKVAGYAISERYEKIYHNASNPGLPVDFLDDDC